VTAPDVRAPFTTLSEAMLSVEVPMRALAAALKRVTGAWTAAFGPCWVPPHRKGVYTCCGCGYRSRLPHKVAAHRLARVGFT
jgi:hypothetical protein